MADVHLGGWKEPKMNELSVRSFKKVIDSAISNSVDFVIIAGDLFNTSIPTIDVLKLAVGELRRLRESSIPVYTIAGSHDFSPSGKTMLDVLEEAGLVRDVCRGSVIDEKLHLDFTIDQSTGVKLTGIIGKKGMLDRTYYENLDRTNLESESGFKIFLFHTSITEMKPVELEKMESAPVSFLPSGFDYYAGGHVHIVRHENFDSRRNVIYPGPIFPNSFSELEKLECGSYYIYDEGKIKCEKIMLAPVLSLNLSCHNKTPAQINEELLSLVTSKHVDGSIVLLRLFGTLEIGKISEINIKRVVEILNERGAYFVMKNTNKLKTKEFEEIKVTANSTEEAEELVVNEHLGQTTTVALSSFDEKKLIEEIMKVLDTEKQEGEKVHDFEERVRGEMIEMFTKKN